MRTHIHIDPNVDLAVYSNLSFSLELAPWYDQVESRRDYIVRTGEEDIREIASSKSLCVACRKVVSRTAPSAKKNSKYGVVSSPTRKLEEKRQSLS